MIRFGHRARGIAAVAAIALLAASCGGGNATDGDSSEEDRDTSGDVEVGSGDTGDEVSVDSGGSEGDAAASFTVGGDRWEFENLVCITGPTSLDVLASQGLIGVSTDPTVVVKILGDWAGTGDGQIQTFDFTMFEGPLTAPDTSWSASLDGGEPSFDVDGNRFTAEGLFDDGLTPGTTEAVEGRFEATCPDPIEAPPVTTTTLPDLAESGSVTVGGETFVFTFDPPGRCGSDAGDGKVANIGVLVDDPTRQVVFTYATAEMSTDGEPALQLIIYDADGNQMWYSAVGYFGDGVGSIESITGDANSVTVSGELQRSGTEQLAPFTAEATCTQ